MRSLKKEQMINEFIPHRLKNISFDYITNSDFLNIEMEIEDIVGDGVLANAIEDKLVISYYKWNPVRGTKLLLKAKPIQISLSLKLPFQVDEKCIYLQSKKGLVSLMLKRKVIEEQFGQSA